MKNRIFIVSIFALGIYYSTINAQTYNLYLNLNYDYDMGKTLDLSPDFHSSIKPFNIKNINALFRYDSLKNTTTKFFINPHHAKLKNKIFNEHLVEIKEGDISIVADPLLNFEAGRDFKGKKYTWVNTRGFQIIGSIGKNFSFYANFYENQASFPEYLDEIFINMGVIPGQGLAKKYGGDGFDYSKASGYISYSPSKYINLQFGTGKHFIGDGYRSLLLSDNAFNYPFFKITTTIWKFQYVNLFTQFQDLPKDLPAKLRSEEEYSPEFGFDKKYAAMHYLNWNVNKRLSLGIFEAIIFEARDSTANKGFEFAYLNPIIFYRPVEFSVGSPDNALLGFNFSYLVGSNNKIYGQFILDELKLEELTSGNGWWGNKFGYQLGAKSYDFFKIPNLFVQAEYNRVRPFTYSHWTSLQNYGHYNQPLAHPLGANFVEFLTIIKYHKNRFYFNYKFIYAKYGENIGDKNYGKDIFLSYETRFSEYNNEIGQGLTTKLFYNNIEISYLINPNYNLNFVLGYTSRITKTDLSNEKNNFLYIGLRTSIENFYYDF